ncbi:MAG: FxsA family protein [Thiobacillus sp.]
MRFGWIVLLLLSFPVIEAVGIFWAASHFKGWVLLALLVSLIAGLALIRIERLAWSARLLFSVQSGKPPFAALFASGRILLAGGLLVFPGFISDAIALILLLIPGTWTGRKRDPLRPANDPQSSPSAPDDNHAAPQTIDGEFTRERDDRLR